jgi:DNA polymerase elongation subunit (family B)
VARPAWLALAPSTSPDRSHELFGCAGTPGIVSVDADTAGRARVWRRTQGRVVFSEQRFPNWFLTTSLDLVAHLPAQRLSADWLRTRHGQVATSEPLAVVELEPPGTAAADAYCYLVLTTHLDEVQTGLVEMSNKRDGGDARTLADLRGLVLIWHPIEQYLTLTGQTYFNGMRFDDLHRLQFDLETTGLDEDRDRIFMVSLRDSSGWQDCLDTRELSEAGVIERFVEAIRARDPDVLENHNIFAFDLPFLVKRAARLGVRLGIGRDGSEPWLETDVFDTGERPEPFLRWRVAGREVIDTQHAVRRFGVAAPDLRRHGLKDAARYFGFARTDREYVPGAEVWPTYRTDPERIRRYAAADVEEVDGLSRRLLPTAFGLASMLPRAYERIAADSGPASLWELMLVRAYLHAGRAIAAPTPRLQHPASEPRAELFLTGVVGSSARVSVRRLLPCVLSSNAIAAANDDLCVLPRLVERLVQDQDSESAQVLAAAAYAYLAGQGLLADPEAANDVSRIARGFLDRLLDDVRTRGCTVLEVDGETVTLALPEAWGEAAERDVRERAAGYLPDGVRVVFDSHYQAMYVRGARTAITLGWDGGVTLIGSAFRAGRLERFGETFVHRAAPCALAGDARGLRRVFLETVHQVRTGRLPLEDLCVQVTLHKSLPQYRRGGTHEEPYEVLLAAGVRSWRVGQRIRYFRARGGEPRLLQEGDGVDASEADTEYYVQRLCGLYCQQFARAFSREDFARIFRLPSGPGPFDEPDTDLAAIRPITTPVG